MVTYNLIGETRPSPDTGNDRQIDRRVTTASELGV